MSNFRGRGRGRGGGNFRHYKQVPCEIFPEIEGLGTCKGVMNDPQIVKRARSYFTLQKYWNESPYFFGEEHEASKKKQKKGIERYADRKLEEEKSKSHLSDFVKIEPHYFPAELCEGEKRKHGSKRVKWDPDSGSKRFDLLEALEKRQADKEDNKEGEEEEDDDKIEDDGEYSDDGDYNQNQAFDDDEDDHNMVDDYDDEGGEF